MQNSNKNSLKIAFCGSICSLSIFLMFLSNVMPFFGMAISAVIGFLLIPIINQFGLSIGFVSYLVICFGSLLVSFDISTTLTFAGFFGIYPLYNNFINKLKLYKYVRILLDIIFYNLNIWLNAYLLNLLFVGQGYNIWHMNPYLLILLIIFLNILCTLYSKVFDKLVYIYNSTNIFKFMKLK